MKNPMQPKPKTKPNNTERLRAILVPYPPATGGAEKLVAAWCGVRAYRAANLPPDALAYEDDQGHEVTVGEERFERLTAAREQAADDVEAAMLNWQPEFFEAIARRMRELQKRPEFDQDKAAEHLALLTEASMLPVAKTTKHYLLRTVAAPGRKVNLSKESRQLAERELGPESLPAGESPRAKRIREILRRSESETRAATILKRLRRTAKALDLKALPAGRPRK